MHLRHSSIRATRSPTARVILEAVGFIGAIVVASLLTACAATRNASPAATPAGPPAARGVAGGGVSPTGRARCGVTNKITVIAAENFWGSIAAQLGADYADVTSIVSKPDTDPHSYEPTSSDARAIAGSDYVVMNGAGYDPWVSKLLGANPRPERTVLDVGASVGVKDGDNPHRWYFPNDVDRVIDRITADYERLLPADSACFEELKANFKSNGLSRYRSLINRIKDKYSGVPVGASESIFVGLAEATGCNLVTPRSFLNAITEGSDPTAGDKATVDQQIGDGSIKVFVFNSQNSTPDVKALVDAATARRLPVVNMTETLTPTNSTFQDWQAKQLQDLLDALDEAAKR